MNGETFRKVISSNGNEIIYTGRDEWTREELMRYGTHTAVKLNGQWVTKNGDEIIEEVAAMFDAKTVVE